MTFAANRVDNSARYNNPCLQYPPNVRIVVIIWNVGLVQHRLCMVGQHGEGNKLRDLYRSVVKAVAVVLNG